MVGFVSSTTVTVFLTTVWLPALSRAVTVTETSPSSLVSSSSPSATLPSHEARPEPPLSSQLKSTTTGRSLRHVRAVRGAAQIHGRRHRVAAGGAGQVDPVEPGRAARGAAPAHDRLVSAHSGRVHHAVRVQAPAEQVREDLAGLALRVVVERAERDVVLAGGGGREAVPAGESRAAHADARVVVRVDAAPVRVEEEELGVERGGADGAGKEGRPVGEAHPVDVDVPAAVKVPKIDGTAPDPRSCAVDGRSPASPFSIAANAPGASPSETATATAVTAIRVRRGVTGFLSRGTEGTAV